MRSRIAPMSGGAALLLLAAMPVVAEEAVESRPTSDVVTDWEGDLDPFAPEAGFAAFSTKQIRPERAKEKRVTMRLRAEVWEVSAIDLVRALDTGADAEALGTWRGGLLQDGTLVLTSILSVDSGYHGSVESITEYIYPTEYEPGEVLPAPDTEDSGLEPVDQPAEVPKTTPTTPTAFEVRNTGTTFEALLKPVAITEKTWDLLFAMETVIPTGDSELGAPELHIKMPVFTTYAVGGLMRLGEAEWQLAASQPAPAGLKKDTTGKSWVTLMRIDKAR